MVVPLQAMLAQELFHANFAYVPQTHMIIKLNFGVHYKIRSITEPLFTMSALLAIMFINTVSH